MSLRNRPFNWRLRLSQLLFFWILSHFLLTAAAAPFAYRRIVTQSVPDRQAEGSRPISNQEMLAEAERRGMSLEVYGIYLLALTLLESFGYFAVAIMIVRQARGQWYLWFTAFFLIFYPTGGGLWLFGQIVIPEVPLRYISAGSLLWPLFWLFLYLFPNGRAVPKFFQWPVGLLALFHFGVMTVFFLAQFRDSNSLLRSLAFFESIEENLNRLSFFLFFGFLLVLTAQVYRYLRVSNLMERMQTRWFVFGLGYYTLFSLLLAWLTDFQLMGGTGYLGDISTLSGLVIPATIGISILRYRLFDIDFVIRRTVLYSSMVAVLTAVYIGAVFGLQAVFRAIAGHESSLAVVLSTLAAAALFNPLRRRMQSAIDRLFFRQKFNSEQAVSSFGLGLRGDIEFDQMANRLVSTVHQSLQPSVMSLWLIPPEEEARQDVLPAIGG